MERVDDKPHNWNAGFLFKQTKGKLKGIPTLRL